MSDSNYIPGLRYSSDTGTLEVLGEGSAHADAHRETTQTDAPVSGIAPESGLNAAERRAETLRAEIDRHYFAADGTMVYTVDPMKRAAFQRELESLETLTIPYQKAKAEEIAAQYAANRAERDARLVQEAALRDEVERRAAEKALDDAANKRAKQIATELRIS